MNTAGTNQNKFKIQILAQGAAARRETSDLIIVTRNSVIGRSELSGKKSNLQRETFDGNIIQRGKAIISFSEKPLSFGEEWRHWGMGEKNR